MTSRFHLGLLWVVGFLCIAAAPRLNAMLLLSDSGYLYPGDEYTYDFTVPQSGTITVYSAGSTDMYGHLHNGSGTELASNDDGGGSLQFSISYSVTPGTYTVRVHGWSTSTSGPFGVYVDFTPSSAPSGNSPPTIDSFSVTPSSGIDHGDSVSVSLDASDSQGDMNAYAIRHVQYGGINPGGVGAATSSGSSHSVSFSYTIPSASPSGSNVFRAEVGDSYSIPGNASTYAIEELTVDVNGPVTPSPPQVAFNSGPSTLAVGQSGTWTYAASDTNGNLSQWAIHVLPASPVWTGISGAIQNGSYSTSFSTPGTYTIRLQARDTDGLDVTLDTTVTVGAPPVIVVQPLSKVVAAGTSVTYSVTATSTSEMSYQWKKGSSNVGTNSPSYTDSSAQSGDEAAYSVAVTNSIGTTTSSDAWLTVLTAHPSNQTGTAGGSASFSATVANASGNSSPGYQWRRNGSPITGNASATTAALSLTSLLAEHAGSYDVVVSNNGSSVTSNPATLVINVLPVITVQPQSRAVALGGTVMFTVVATGTPTPTYQWKKGGVNLSNGGNISDATGTAMTVSNIQSGDLGTYTVAVTNVAGTVISAGAALTVSDLQLKTHRP